MVKSDEVVHVTWGSSRAESVREALRLQGVEEGVVALFGVFNVGPINPPDPASRRAWIEKNLRGDPTEHVGDPEEPWTIATQEGVRPVYWVCLSDAGEHACFLEFVFRMAGRPFDIVDVTGSELIVHGRSSPVLSLGSLRPEEVVSLGLAGRRRPFTEEESCAARAVWSKLRNEDATLRVVRDGRLVSAPITHFDSVLTDLATSDYEVAAKLIGRVLQHLSEEVDPPEIGASDEVLFSRIMALADAGILERTGSGPGTRDYRVRRPDTMAPDVLTREGE